MNLTAGFSYVISVHHLSWIYPFLVANENSLVTYSHWETWQRAPDYSYQWKWGKTEADPEVNYLTECSKAQKHSSVENIPPLHHIMAFCAEDGIVFCFHDGDIW